MDHHEHDAAACSCVAVRSGGDERRRCILPSVVAGGALGAPPFCPAPARAPAAAWAALRGRRRACCCGASWRLQLLPLLVLAGACCWVGAAQAPERAMAMRANHHPAACRRRRRSPRPPPDLSPINQPSSMCSCKVNPQNAVRSRGGRRTYAAVRCLQPGLCRRLGGHRVHRVHRLLRRGQVTERAVGGPRLQFYTKTQTISRRGHRRCALFCGLKRQTFAAPAARPRSPCIPSAAARRRTCPRTPGR